MQSEHPLGTLSCITGSQDHHPSNTLTPYKRCKPRWGFWVGFLGVLLVLGGVEYSKMAGREPYRRFKEPLRWEAPELLTNRMQNVLPKVKGKMKTLWLLLISFMTHRLGVLKSCFSDASSKTIIYKSWKQNPERYSLSMTASLTVSFSTYPNKREPTLFKLICSGFVFDAVYCKTVHPFPDL